MKLKDSYFSYLFGALPFFSFFLQRQYSANNGLLNEFKQHFIVNYLDWIFVFVNLFFLNSVSQIPRNIKTVLALVLCVAGNIWLCNYWGLLNEHGVIESHFYAIRTNVINFAGIVHFIFSVFESFIIVLLFLYARKNQYSFLSFSLLALFFLLNILNSYIQNNFALGFWANLPHVVALLLIVMKIITLQKRLQPKQS